MRYHALPLLVAIVFLLVASHAWSAVVMVDADSDGLSDQEEVKLFTDPLVADSDEDGLLDGVEFHMGSNPLIADSDEDGLSDGDELARGTDILLSDSDEDWFNDGLEVREGTDPLDKSSVPPGTVRQVDEIAADQREVSAFRAELLYEEVPVKRGDGSTDRKKHSSDELAGIKADFDPITDELQVQIRDEAKVAASQRRFFIDFDRDVTTRQ